MFLTITSTATDASDLGYLLHKHPDRAQRFDLSVGTAHVFYPEASDTRCTAALLLEVDPVGLVRGQRGEGFALAQYVNDRPYAASSMLAVALGRVFSTALKGRCDARPELVDAALPLEIHVPAVPARDGAGFVREVFEPLGWDVTTNESPLDPQVPAWGPAPYVDLILVGRMRLADALSHLYVLLPVLDGAKHYWVGPDEVDKLVRSGGGWLAAHPLREQITARYLAHQRRYVTDATARLTELDGDLAETLDVPEVDGADETHAARAEPGDATGVPLRRQRLAAILAALRDLRAGYVIDLGCGEGALLWELLKDPAFTRIVGVDVSARELERAEKRLDLERLPDRTRARVELRQSSVTYRDSALAGADAIVLSEVIEHVDLGRLPALEQAVFARSRPTSVIVTTPNAEYNALYPQLVGMRHPDHRFEWTRNEFAAWADRVGADHGYRVDLGGIGDVDATHGSPTQMAVFIKITDAAGDAAPHEGVRADQGTGGGHRAGDTTHDRSRA